MSSGNVSNRREFIWCRENDLAEIFHNAMSDKVLQDGRLIYLF